MYLIKLCDIGSQMVKDIGLLANSQNTNVDFPTQRSHDVSKWIYFKKKDIW